MIDHTATFWLEISASARESAAPSGNEKARCTSGSSCLILNVISVMIPVMPSASAMWFCSPAPSKTRTSPEGSTTRADTTLSLKVPYSYEPNPAPPWASQPAAPELGVEDG